MREHAGLDVGLVVADDLVGHGFATVSMVLEFDRGAEDDATVGIEQRAGSMIWAVAELALDLLDAPLDEALALLGGLVLGVLERSPCARASAMAAMTAGRSTVFSRCSSCAQQFGTGVG